MSTRYHYVDWLRALAVLLLFLFHTSRVFDAYTPFYVKAPQTSAAFDYALGFVHQWHMPLFFVLAGMSSFFALGKRTGAHYARERVKRLLAPFLFGFLVLIPPQTWIGATQNSGYEGSFAHYLLSAGFLRWNIQDGGDYFGGFGLGHLWFIIALWIVSMAGLPLMLRWRGLRAERTRRWARRLARPGALFVPALLIFVGEALPDLAGINLFYYGASFFLGFVIAADEAFVEAAERYRWPAFLVGAAASIGYVVSWEVRDALPDPSVPLALITLAACLGSWLVIVGLLGFGRRHLDRPSPALAYLGPASYPVYIIHQTAIVIAAYHVVRLDVGMWGQWATLLVAGAVSTFAVYEIVRRLPLVRLAFGIRGRA